MVQAGKVVRSAVVNHELSQNYKQQMPIAGVRFKPLKGKRGIGKEIFFPLAHLRLGIDYEKTPRSPAESFPLPLLPTRPTNILCR